MIDRITLFKFRQSGVDEASRARLAAETHASLSAAPGVQEVRVGVPADEASARSWDLSVVLRFEDLAAMERFLADPGFTAWFEGAMAPYTEVVKYWCFEATDGCVGTSPGGLSQPPR